MTLALEKLIGSWVLADWVEMKDGAIAAYPMGKGATGRIFYAANGTMAAFLSHENWANEAADTPATLDKFLSYAGRFTVEGTTVRHAVDQSSLPFMIGTTLTRKVLELADNRLVLEADIPGRDDAVWHLIWDRV